MKIWNTIQAIFMAISISFWVWLGLSWLEIALQADSFNPVYHACNFFEVFF